MTGVAALRQAASLLVDYGVEAACLYLRPVTRETDAALGSRFAASSRLLDSGCRAAMIQRTADDEGCENSAKEGLLLRLIREALGGGNTQAAADTSPLQQQQQRAAVIGSECVFPALCRVLKQAGWRFISLESACRRAAAAAATSRGYSQPHGGNRPGESVSSLESHLRSAPADDDDAPFGVLEGRRRPGYLEGLFQGCGAARVVLMTHEQAQELFSSSAGGDEEAAAASKAFPIVIEYAVEPPLLMAQQPGRDGNQISTDGSRAAGCGPRRWGIESAVDASPIVRTSAGQDGPVCVEGHHSSGLRGCLPRHVVLAVRAPASVMGAAAPGGGGVAEQEGVDEGVRGYEDGRFQQEQQVDETAESLVGSVAAAAASTGGLSCQEELPGSPWRGSVRCPPADLPQPFYLGSKLDEVLSHGGDGGGEEESSRLLPQAVRLTALQSRLPSHKSQACDDADDKQ